MGYLLDEQGATASPLAVGSQAILDLATARPAEWNGSWRQGSSLGTATRARASARRRAGSSGTAYLLGPRRRTSCCPGRGRELSLNELRGRRVLLVFSDPHAGRATRSRRS